MRFVGREESMLVLAVQRADLLAIVGALNWSLSPFPVGDAKRRFAAAFDQRIGVSAERAAALLDEARRVHAGGGGELRVAPAELMAISRALATSLAGSVAIFDGDIHTLTGADEAEFARTAAEAEALAGELAGGSAGGPLPDRPRSAQDDDPGKRFFDALL